ncbi:MAG: hypothetical protein ACW98K_05800 [Candidatus Kariarchaeaceae archaeon]|jgi:hypothetical protein
MEEKSTVSKRKFLGKIKAVLSDGSLIFSLPDEVKDILKVTDAHDLNIFTDEIDGNPVFVISSKSS